MLPSGVERHEMNMRMWHIGANDFHENARVEYGFHVEGDFFDGCPESEPVGILKFVDFVDLSFGDDKDMPKSFRMNVEKSVGMLVFVNFVTGDFSRDDF